jgi:hypothetical protein
VDDDKTMSVEQAKEQLLNPIPEAERASFVKEHAMWLAGAAFALGVLTGRPRRLAQLARLGVRAAVSPMVQRGVLLLLLQGARRQKPK